MIKPDSLAEFVKSCDSPESIGRVLMALFGRPCNDLTHMEKCMVNVIAADCKKMEQILEERREKGRERQRKWYDSHKKGGKIKNLTQPNAPINQSIIQSTNQSTNQSTEPNNARGREVAASPFGSVEISQKERDEAKRENDLLANTYVEQFNREMREALKAGNMDAAFYDKNVPAEHICCAVARDHAVGTWRAYVNALGEDAVRDECCTFFHECNAGEEPKARACALNARLKRLKGERDS